MKALGMFVCGLAVWLTPLGARADLPALVHIFGRTDTPLRVTADGSGNLYGVEPAGGDYGDGSIFKVAANGTVTVLYSFAGPTTGSGPLPLTLGADGNLYGFTTRGGTTAANFGNFGHGTFFRLTPAGAFTLLANFNVSDDVVSPTLPPILLADGSFEGLADGSSSGRGGAIFHVDGNGTVTVVISYPEVNSSRNNNLPTNLISAGGGVFYASTPNAGLGYGTVFRLNADASTTLLLTFGNDANGGYPGGLVYAGDGTLYGITGSGGSNGAGTFYKVNPQGAFSTLTSLTVGSSSLLTAANDSAVTRGGNVLYRVPAGGTPSVFYTAPTNIGGVLPNADGTFTVSLAGADGSGNGSSIVRVTATGAGTTFATLPTGGTAPVAALTPGAGLLYGTTSSGGANNQGVLFSVAANGAFQKLTDFTGANGAMPRAGLTPDGLGNFFGVTSAGGANGGGEFFKVASNGGMTPLYSFASGSDGNSNFGNDPESPLIAGSGSLFYGITRQGGRPQNAASGTVYTLTAAGQFSQIAQLAGQGGYLVAGGDGNFYGTTGGDGDGAGDGTIFQVTPTGAVTVKAQFDGLNTGSSQATAGGFATILRATDGNFYGTTYTGGQFGHGTIWRMLASDFSLTAIYSFTGGSFTDAVSDGGAPQGGLLQGINDRMLYGTTSTGGPLGGGTVFQATLGGFVTTIYGFAEDVTSGQTPLAALAQTTDGTIYGSTSVGLGANGGGTIFRFNPAGSPTPTPTPTPTVTPTPTPPPGSTPTPTPSPTPTPPPGSTPTPTPLPSPLPTATPTPTPAPSPLHLLGLNVHSAGNTGDATVNISGSGIAPGASVRLTASGQNDVVSSASNLLDAGFTLSASFSLKGAAAVVYDLIVTNPDGATAILPAAFTVTGGGAPDIYFDVVGPPAARALHTTPYFLVVGNRGAVDAYMVPVAFSVSGGYQVQTNVRTVTIPLVDALPPINYPLQLADSLAAAGSVDEPLNLVTEGDVTVGAFYLPVVPANSVANVLLNVTVSAGGQRPTFYVQGLAAAPELSSLGKLEQAAAELSSARQPSTRSHPAPRVDPPKDPPPTDPSAYPNPLYDKVIVPILDIFKKKPDAIVPIATVLNKAAKPVEQTPTTPVTIPADPYPYFDPFPNTPDIFGPFGDPAPPGPPPPPPPDSQPVIPGRSSDPNDKQGSVGVGGTAQYISGGVPLRYIVDFENEVTATLPAQRVVVTDPLDANDDLSTFSLGPIGFGSTVLTPPPNVASYSTQVDLRPGVNILVNVSAQLDAGSRVVNWTFQSIDPVTGAEPVDPRFGFLPPNVASPAGQGFVFYTVQPKAGLPTGTTITNQATIYFDENPPIPTPVWTNTIDSGAPASTLQPIAKSQFTSKIKLKVTGADDASGVANYSIYASDNKGPFHLVLSGQPGPKINFEGTTGHKYEFFAQARDATGNVEPLKIKAEAKTKISGPDLIGAWEGSVTTKTSANGTLKLKGKLTVTNQSLKEPTTTGGAVRFYISSLAVFDASAQVIGHDAPFDAIAPGGSVTVSIPGGKLPASVASASGLYVYAVLDVSGTVGETDKNNNTVPYGLLP